MGYMHIDNLYKNPATIFAPGVTEVYALEKLHGTSAHVAWRHGPKQLHLFHGGGSAAVFAALFDVDALRSFFTTNWPSEDVTVFGEFYGGSILKQSHVYGAAGKFAAFDVKVGERWLSVPEMASCCAVGGFEVVEWKCVPATLEVLDAERDADSTQAIRNGMGPGKRREGIVVRPIVEGVDRFGNRIIAKHKGAEFSERASVPQVSMEKVQAMSDAAAIAEEWVVPHRLEHVLQRFPGETLTDRDTRRVIDAMIEDVRREGAGEIEWSSAVGAAIAKRTAGLFLASLREASAAFFAGREG